MVCHGLIISRDVTARRLSRAFRIVGTFKQNGRFLRMVLAGVCRHFYHDFLELTITNLTCLVYFVHER